MWLAGVVEEDYAWFLCHVFSNTWTSVTQSSVCLACHFV